jgi:hypothetical protein
MRRLAAYIISAAVIASSMPMVGSCLFPSVGQTQQTIDEVNVMNKTTKKKTTEKKTTKKRPAKKKTTKKKPS